MEQFQVVLCFGVERVSGKVEGGYGSQYQTHVGVGQLEIDIGFCPQSVPVCPGLQISPLEIRLGVCQDHLGDRHVAQTVGKQQQAS